MFCSHKTDNEVFMKINMLILLVLYSVIILLFTFCSAQPTIRYEDQNKKKESTDATSINKKSVKFEEDFDITPFRTEITLPEKKIEFKNSSSEIWYQYDLKENSGLKTKKISGTMNGFRVQVIATDDLDEANKIQEELKAIKGNNEIYSVFEPPFYKILIGDFKNSDEANSLRFKLNQLGYSDSKVIKSTINLFEQ